MSKKGRRVPSETCSLCNKSLQDVGGYRIAHAPSRGIMLTQEEKHVSMFACDVEHLKKVYIVRLKGDCQQLSLIFWGDEWTQETIEKVCNEVYAHKHPWICELCAGYICSKCKEKPMANPPQAGILQDDGRTSHFPILPVPTFCMDCHSH